MERGQRTLLVVEDNAAHAEAIRRAFISFAPKIEIVGVATLKEFRERVAQNPPDLAIMDLNLPDGRAVEVMSNPPENGPFPILLMTSFGNESVAVEAIKSGAIDYIVKSPEAFADMPRTVERALREWSLLADRKRAEHDSRESEARFHTLSRQFNALLDALPDRIILCDPDLRVIWANRAATSELTQEEIESGKPHCCMTQRDQTDHPSAPCPTRRSLQSGMPAFEIITAPDKKIWELRAIPVKEAEQVVSVIEISRDISEQRRLEDQLRQAQKMDAVGRLAGGVAHDFNNMLSVILGYAELALDRVAASEPIYNDLQIIFTAAKRSSDITRQLLAFARKQTIAPKVLDLNETVEGMLKMLRRLIGEDINLAWLPATKLWPVMMDPSQVDQLLANLCVNARDAIAGVGKVTIETGMVTFDQAYCADHPGFVPGNFILLAVSDDGCGMKKDVMDKLFEPFFTTKEEGKGTGLGLATVYGIVKQNNGFINVYSEPDQGTTFKIYLPRHQGVSGEITTEDAARIPLGQGETVLIVEDEVAILELSRAILEKLGYIVLTASTPNEALRLASTQGDAIQLLITDVIMPEMNGRELTTQLHTLYPGIKSLFMSGYTADVIAHRGVLDEGICFIQKPFSTRDFATKVREALTGEC